MGQKKTAEAEAKKTETRRSGDRIAELDKQVAEAEADSGSTLMLQIAQSAARNGRPRQNRGGQSGSPRLGRESAV